MVIHHAKMQRPQSHRIGTRNIEGEGATIGDAIRVFYEKLEKGE